MPSAIPPSRRLARAGIRLPAAALVLAIGFAGCSSSPESTCNDVSGFICEKLATCGALTGTFATPEQCTASFNGFFEVGGSDDAGCRDEWAQSESLDCLGFIDRYSL